MLIGYLACGVALIELFHKAVQLLTSPLCLAHFLPVLLDGVLLVLVGRFPHTLDKLRFIVPHIPAHALDCGKNGGFHFRGGDIVHGTVAGKLAVAGTHKSVVQIHARILPGFRKFIENAEKELNLEIETIACPADADVRQAKISTILEAGDSSIDIFSVNDEMISEFKYKDYLKPLNDTVMTKELLSSYPESYMQNVPMKDGKVYSVPYLMDIMVFWVNREVTGDREIRTQEDFAAFLKENLGNDVYGYGGAWDQSYVYNELSEFVNLFGGDYYDWENKNTREALSFLHDLTANGEVPISQITDRYEQIEQKFLDGKYGSIFMYSGAINTFECAGAYRMEKIQVAPLPGFRKNATNIATWQYVLNKASEHEKAAIKFLKYAASREGNIAYAECMKRLPARLDVIREEKLDIPGFQVFQDYVNHVELKERPFSSNSNYNIISTYYFNNMFIKI